MEVDPSDEEAEEGDDEAAGLAKEPEVDLKSRVNAFTYIGTNIAKLEATDMGSKPATKQLALGAWRAHVWDFVASLDSVVNSAICSGASRQLTPSMTEELLTHYNDIQDVRAIFARNRDVEIPQLYGLCMRYHGDGLHPLPHPQLTAPMARLMLVGDSTCYTQGTAGKKSAKMWHGRLKSTLCWNLTGEAMWGKGLNDMFDSIKS